MGCFRKGSGAPRWRRTIPLCVLLATSSARVLAQATGARPDGEPPPAADAGPEPVQSEPSAVSITVVGQRSAAQRLQGSAEAVTVVNTRKARQQTADLGEVLARTQGVNVRRQGGLGSTSRIALNGLQGEQIRFFVDGVPLAIAGYPFGLTDLPVNLLDRVEVYRGVVPIRFGADALGGAINVVTDQSYETHLGASYQIGSFGQLRTTLAGRYRHEPTGLIAGGAIYLDLAENDYMMDDRPVPRPDGQADFRSLPRFHDAYQAYGGYLEIGVVDRKWARKLILQGFFGTFDKELQHNAVMSVPYGEVTYGASAYGATVRYEADLSPTVQLGLLFSYAFRRWNWRDMATHRYRWTGERARLVGRERAPGEPARGEITGVATDQSYYPYAVYARTNLDWTLAPGHVARLSITPQLRSRTGEDHVPNRVDLLGLEESVKNVVAGVEYELDLFDDRMSNIVFGKAYYQRVDYEGLTERGSQQVQYELDHASTHFGVGDSVRYRFADWILAKLSYEYATRLPLPEELFGDGVLVHSNPDLHPERSHNLNLGPRVELSGTPLGQFTADLNGFARDTKDLIVLLPSVQGAPYSNILDVRSIGLDTSLSWDAPGRFVGLDFSCTYQDIRNTSTTGVFMLTKGRRMPSRPWLFGSAGVRGRVPGLLGGTASLEPYFYSRYVHTFDRGWALGDPEFKLMMPSQWSHDVGLTYSFVQSFGKLASTFEIDNLTDEALFDVYGVQRPGRSFNFKITGDI
jgi:outer membrane receptor protein involved in Fe transport